MHWTSLLRLENGREDESSTAIIVAQSVMTTVVVLDEAEVAQE